jgi:hypothetical protein
MYILVYKIEPMRRFIIFSTDNVDGGVKNFKYVCPEFLCCLWSNKLVFMVLLMVLNLRFVPGFIFES